MIDPEAPLRGRRIVVPVTPERRALADKLHHAGAAVDEVRFIEILPARNQDTLDAAALRWVSGEYSWLVVTSRNAVHALAKAAQVMGNDLADTHVGSRVAAVGGSTLEACGEYGMAVDLVPEMIQSANGLVAEFADAPMRGGRVLAPQGSLASDEIKRGLEAKGWTVDVVEAYRTVAGPGPNFETVAALASGEAHAVVLTSGSVAEALAHTCPTISPDVAVIAMGVSTAAAAAAAGIVVTGIAPMPTYEGVIAALEQHLRMSSGAGFENG